jgi:hypothetical protein
MMGKARMVLILKLPLRGLEILALVVDHTMGRVIPPARVMTIKGPKRYPDCTMKSRM